MKHEDLKPCAVCYDSGVERGEGEPGLGEHRWCLSCEAGRAKADWVAELVRRSLSERKLAA